MSEFSGARIEARSTGLDREPSSRARVRRQHRLDRVPARVLDVYPGAIL